MPRHRIRIDGREYERRAPRRYRHVILGCRPDADVLSVLAWARTYAAAQRRLQRLRTAGCTRLSVWGVQEIEE